MRDNLPKMLRDAAKKWREKHKVVGVGEMRYDFALEEAADAIEELSKPRWIPVTERLPEIEEDVLIAATVHTKKGDVRAVTGDFINTAGQWNGANCSWRYEVTHWMPLPTPPKGEP